MYLFTQFARPKISAPYKKGSEFDIGIRNYVEMNACFC